MRHHAQPAVILVVDDDPDCRALIREGISQASGVNCRVMDVPDGKSALDFIHHRGEYGHAPRPALVILDLELPDMLGSEVLADIRKHNKVMPVVMMTGVCDEEEMKKAACNGANSYIIKPADAVNFIQKVKLATEYWITVHQCLDRHLSVRECRR